MLLAFILGAVGGAQRWRSCMPRSPAGDAERLAEKAEEARARAAEAAAKGREVLTQGRDAHHRHRARTRGLSARRADTT